MAGPKITATIEIADLTKPQLDRLESALSILGRQAMTVGEQAGNSLSAGFEKAGMAGQAAGEKAGAALKNGFSEAGAAGQQAGEKIVGGMRAADSAVVQASNGLHRLFNMGGNGTTLLMADNIKISMSGIKQAADNAEVAVTRTQRAVQGILDNLHSAAQIGGMIVGTQMVEQAHNILHKGMSYQEIRAHGIASGMTADDMKTAEIFSDEAAQRYGGLAGKDEALRSYIEARSVMSDPKHAAEGAEIAIKAKAALKAGGGSEDQVATVDRYIKAAELLGYTDPSAMSRYVEDNLKAMQVMGSTISPEDQAAAVKYARNAGAHLSPEFIATTMNSLAQEVGGSTTGVLLRDFYQHVIGGHMTHQGLKNLVAAGVVNPDDVTYTSTGEAKGFLPGKHVSDFQLAMTNPDNWVLGVNDKLRAQGKSAEEIAAWWSGSFDSGTADFAVKTTQQHNTWARHAELFREATGFNAPAAVQNGGNIVTDFRSLLGNVENLATTVGDAALNMGTFKDTVHAANKAVGAASDKATDLKREHPESAGAGAWATIAALLGGGSLLAYGSGLSLIRSVLGIGGKSAGAGASTAAEGSTVTAGGLAGPAALAAAGSFLTYVRAQWAKTPAGRALGNATLNNPMLGAMDPDTALGAASIGGDAVDEIVSIQRAARERTKSEYEKRRQLHMQTRDRLKQIGDGDFAQGIARLQNDALAVPSKESFGQTGKPAAAEVHVEGKTEITQTVSIEVGLDGKTRRDLKKVVTTGLTTDPAKLGKPAAGPARRDE